MLSNLCYLDLIIVLCITVKDLTVKLKKKGFWLLPLAANTTEGVFLPTTQLWLCALAYIKLCWCCDRLYEAQGMGSVWLEVPTDEAFDPVTTWFERTLTSLCWLLTLCLPPSHSCVSLSAGVVRTLLRPVSSCLCRWTGPVTVCCWPSPPVWCECPHLAATCTHAAWSKCRPVFASESVPCNVSLADN